MVLGGHRFKRIQFGDSGQAARIARALEYFAERDVLPAVEARFDSELLLEWIEGDRLDGFDASHSSELARFYAVLYDTTDPGNRAVPTHETAIVARTARDLRFLRDVGVIDDACATELLAATQSLAPAELWIGHDYTDAVPKNFIRHANGRIYGIDAEALVDDGLIGIGVAKSLDRGGPAFREGFLAEFQKLSELPLVSLLPFVELVFQIRWQKNLFLKGSAGRMEPERLERFRTRPRAPKTPSG